MAGRDLSGQRAHTGWLAAGCVELKAGRDGRVDARSQAGIGTVPGDRNGMALGQNVTAAGIAKQELPLGEDLVELTPVVVEDRAVLVVLGPDVSEQLPGALPQFRPLAVAHNLRVHTASIGIWTCSSDRIFQR
jgi:hypothetical protein